MPGEQDGQDRLGDFASTPSQKADAANSIETWDQQVKVLMGRLASEKSSLRGASGTPNSKLNEL
ncbi:hypothetical protein ABZ766_22675 [Streptomyces sp. NPDC006670]|uniref:hypothetical protein n=1 Tax=Streptomyces sp. NPDC006670 TaxID=3154476 RepID=UPI0033CB1613